MAKKKNVDKLVSKMLKKAAAKKAKKGRASFGWKASEHPELTVAQLQNEKKMKDGTLHFIMYRLWRGYKIARGQNDVEKLKYYAKGIDKVKQEMDRRGIKDKHSNPLTRHATPFPPRKVGDKKLPRYADGLWLRETKGGAVKIIAPIKIIK